MADESRWEPQDRIAARLYRHGLRPMRVVIEADYARAQCVRDEASVYRSMAKDAADEEARAELLMTAAHLKRKARKMEDAARARAHEEWNA